MDKEELKIEILVKEYDSIAQGIRTLFLTSEKVVGLSIPVIAAALAFGLKEKINEILLFLPIAFFGVLFYGIYMFTELTSLGGYKRYLEDRINTACGENILLWESFIAKKRHHVFVSYFLYIVYVLFLGLASVISLSTACQHYGRWVFWVIVVLLLGLSIGSLISLVKMYKAFDKTYQMAKTQFEKGGIGTPPPTAQEQ